MRNGGSLEDAGSRNSNYMGAGLGAACKEVTATKNENCYMLKNNRQIVM